MSKARVSGATRKPLDTSWFVEQERRIAEAGWRRKRIVPHDSLPRVPSAGTDYAHLYLIEFSTGVVKVGRTISPKERLATHTRSARIHGVDVLRSWVSERHHGCVGTERQLIDLCGRLGARVEAEYFRGVPFDKVQMFALLLAGCAASKHALGVRTEEDRKRRAYLDRLTAAASGDLSMTWKEAHERLGEGPIEGDPPP